MKIFSNDQLCLLLLICLFLFIPAICSATCQCIVACNPNGACPICIPGQDSNGDGYCDTTTTGSGTGSGTGQGGSGGSPDDWNSLSPKGMLEIQGTCTDRYAPYSYEQWSSAGYDDIYVTIKVDKVIYKSNSKILVNIGDYVTAHSKSYPMISDFQVGDELVAGGLYEKWALWCDQGFKESNYDQYYIDWADHTSTPKEDKPRVHLNAVKVRDSKNSLLYLGLYDSYGEISVEKGKPLYIDVGYSIEPATARNVNLYLKNSQGVDAASPKMNLDVGAEKNLNPAFVIKPLTTDTYTVTIIWSDYSGSVSDSKQFKVNIKISSAVTPTRTIRVTTTPTLKITGRPLAPLPTLSGKTVSYRFNKGNLITSGVTSWNSGQGSYISSTGVTVGSA